jgi:chromosome segregation ATPase
MASKIQIDLPVADLRARIDGKIRFGHTLNGYNQAQVNVYIDELKHLHDQEIQEIKAANIELKNQYNQLEVQKNMLNSQSFQMKAELESLQSKTDTKITILTDKIQSQLEELTEIKEKYVGLDESFDPIAMNKVSEENAQINSHLETTKIDLQKAQDQMIRLQKGYSQLNEENIRISAALEMRNCEYESEKEQVQKLEIQNNELTNRTTRAEMELNKYRLEGSEKLSVVSAWEKNALAELQTKLNSSLTYLNSYTEKSAELWDKLNKE